MRLQKKINFKLTALLLVAFFVGCQPKHDAAHDEANKSDKKETVNQTAVRVSAENTNAAEPSIAADSSGNVYVVFVEHNADKSADIYLQKFDASGKTSGEKTRINPEKGQAKAWFGDAPTVKIGRDNTIFVGWTAKIDGAEKSAATILNLSVSADGGKTFAAPVKVNDDTAPASHGMHSLAVGQDNRVFMAWLDERNIKTEKASFNQKNENLSGFQIVKIHHNSNKAEKPKAEKKEMKDEEAEPNSEVFFAISNDGGKTFSANKKISSEVCPCCKTSVTTAPDGKVFVSWRQVLENKFRHIAVASSANGGESFENPVIVSDDQWEINACPVSGASMSVGAQGALKIIWYTAGKAGNPGLYYAESKDAGKTFSPRALVSPEIVTGTSTVLGETAEKSRIVFAAANNQIVIGAAENSATNFSVRQTIDGAQLPAAAFAGEKLFVAFVKGDEKNKSVWLIREN
jgi:hypothetical protein